jgi:hypothetical protein
MTMMEAAGAALVYLLVAIISTPDASLTLPIIGDLTQVFPARSSREIKLVGRRVRGGVLRAAGRRRARAAVRGQPPREQLVRP